MTQRYEYLWKKLRKMVENLRDRRKSVTLHPLFGVTAVVWAEELPDHVAQER